MTRDDIIRMAREAGFEEGYGNHLFPPGDYREEVVPVTDEIIRFAALVAAAEREKVARWIIQKGYATGHGDTIEDLLTELEWQVAEREREACAKVCERMLGIFHPTEVITARCAKAIRARSET